MEMETQALIEQIKGIVTAEDMTRVSALLESVPGKMAPEVQKALLDKLAEFTAKSQAAKQEAIDILKLHGVDYPLTDWLTPRNYAKKFNLAGDGQKTVNNWVRRGIIPTDHVKDIPELDIRLVRAVEYKPRAYKLADTDRIAEQSKDA